LNPAPCVPDSPHHVVAFASPPDRPSAFIEPCLPSPAKTPPAGDDWLHEIKHDGYRLMIRRDGVGFE
jgi:ATP-dependent DNA ligase